MQIKFDKLSRAKDKERLYIKNELQEMQDLDKYRDYFSSYHNEILKNLNNNSEFLNSTKVENYFDPEKSLLSILKLEKGIEKDEALNAFKYLLVKQQHGLMLLKNDIFDIIQNSDIILKEDLYNKIYEYQNLYKFSPNQIDIIKSMILEFEERHLNVNSFYKKYKGDPYIIFNKIFKTHPAGKIQIKKGPISLAFICSDLTDYARIHSGNFSGILSEDISRQDLSNANDSGGIYTYTAPLDLEYLSSTIIGVNGDGEYAQNTILHEEQHALNNIYESKIQTIERKYFYLNLYSASNIEDAKKIIKAYCNGIIGQAAERAKDEIIAYKTTNSDNSYILDILTRSKKDGGLYDYFDVDDTLENIRNNIKSFDNSQAPLDIAKNIIIYKYKDLIEEGIFAFDLLKSKGYEFQSIVALLMQYPLNKWKKIASRNIENNPSLINENDKFGYEFDYFNISSDKNKFEDMINPEEKALLLKFKENLK